MISLSLADLFAKIIAQSGSALATWVIDRNPVTSALAIARLANCNQTDMADLTACLREIPVKDLLLAHSKFLVSLFGTNTDLCLP
jgi:carboxylesterase type B